MDAEVDGRAVCMPLWLPWPLGRRCMRLGAADDVEGRSVSEPLRVPLPAMRWSSADGPREGGLGARGVSRPSSSVEGRSAFTMAATTPRDSGLDPGGGGLGLLLWEDEDGLQERARQSEVLEVCEVSRLLLLLRDAGGVDAKSVVGDE